MGFQVACSLIQYGKGVCGVAASKRQTQIVENVHAFPGHIACDSESNSEIVIPISSENGEVAKLKLLLNPSYLRVIYRFCLEYWILTVKQKELLMTRIKSDLKKFRKYSPIAVIGEILELTKETTNNKSELLNCKLKGQSSLCKNLTYLIRQLIPFRRRQLLLSLLAILSISSIVVTFVPVLCSYSAIF